MADRDAETLNDAERKERNKRETIKSKDSKLPVCAPTMIQCRRGEDSTRKHVKFRSACGQAAAHKVTRRVSSLCVRQQETWCKRSEQDNPIHKRLKKHLGYTSGRQGRSSVLTSTEHGGEKWEKTLEDAKTSCVHGLTDAVGKVPSSPNWDADSMQPASDPMSFFMEVGTSTLKFK